MPSYPCVGTVGKGLFAADFAGPEGKPVLFSGAIRVHRIGGLEDDGRQFVYECYGKCWPGRYLEDANAARWYGGVGGATSLRPATTDGVALATEKDYYDVILPAVRRLERSLSAEAEAAELEPIRVGLVDCWAFRD